MNEKVKNFVKNWKDELRSRIQPIVKAGKRKPTITIIRIGDTPDSGIMEMAKDIGFIGDLYQIPLDSGITQKDLFSLALDADTDEVYIEEPLPGDFYNPVATGEQMKRGVSTYLKSLNIDPVFNRVVVSFISDGCEIQMGEERLNIEDFKLLEQMAVLEDGIKYWEDDRD